MQPVSNTAYAVMALIFFVLLALMLTFFGSDAIRGGVAVALLFAGLSQFLAQSSDDRTREGGVFASVVSGIALTIATLWFFIGTLF